MANRLKGYWVSVSWTQDGERYFGNFYNWSDTKREAEEEAKNDVRWSYKPDEDSLIANATLAELGSYPAHCGNYPSGGRYYELGGSDE